MSLLSLLPALGSQAYGIYQGSKLRKDLAEKQRTAQTSFDRSLQAIRDISFDPSQEQRAARMSQIQAGGNIADMAAQRTEEAQARAIAALRDSPRALQSAGTRVIDSALAAQNQADVSGTQMKLAGEMGMAEDAEKARLQGLQRDMNLENMLLGRAGQAGDVAQQGIYGSQAAEIQGIMGMGNTLTQGLLQLEAPTPTTNYGFGGQGGDGFTPKTFTVPPAPETYTGSMGSYKIAEQGGYIGEQGGMTEGEFDHDTNKKAIVDEENGQKEGELTGGEMVFNPEQTEGLTSMVEKGDAEGLLMFLRDLLSEPQFQEA